MIIVLKAGSTDAEVEDVCGRIERMGYRAHTIRGELRTVIGAMGDDRGKDRLKSLESLECVEAVQPILQPFKLASREVRREATVVPVEGVRVCGNGIVVMAGACSVESRGQVLEVAAKVKAAGARVLRGGAFKPRTSPYSFQGLEEEGLKYLAEAKRETGLPVVTEVMEPDKVDLVARYSDILQIGARNIQNFSLLRRVAGTRATARGTGSTWSRWPWRAWRRGRTGSSSRCTRGPRKRCRTVPSRSSLIGSPRWSSAFGASPGPWTGTSNGYNRGVRISIRGLGRRRAVISGVGSVAADRLVLGALVWVN